MKKQPAILFIVMFFTGTLVSGQDVHFNDSLRNNIKKAATDSLRIEAMYGYMKTNLNNNTSDFEPYIKQMASLSRKIKFKWGLSTAYILGLSYHKNQGDYENALKYADSALAVTNGDTSGNMRINLGHIFLNRGNLMYNMGDYENALSNYFKASAIYKREHHKLLASTYSNISNCFMELSNSPKAIEYSLAAVQTAKSFDDKRLLATNMMNLATAYMNKGDYPAADSLMNLVWPVVVQLQNSKSFHAYYYNKGDVEAYYRKDTIKALGFYRKSYECALKNEDVSQQAKALDLMISLQLNLEQKAVKDNIDKLYQLAVENRLDDETAAAFNFYSTWYRIQKDYKKAYEYQSKYIEISDSIHSVSIKEKAAMMETRFRVANKEQEINELKATHKIQQLSIRQKDTLNYLFAASAIAILIISVLGYRNHKSRQNLQQSKIDELEKEKQLTATEAVLKGEEQERTRLAKDLHDGLGGMLSGIKFSLNNMKGNLIMTPDNAQALERSIDMLDSSIREMRRVAHNMMPEVLVRYGLNDALKEFCSEIDQSGVVHINYQSIGMEKIIIEQTVSITIYRIVQELVNNAIKHAMAKNVLVQLHLTQPERLLTVTVEDDGKGFDTALLKQSSGIGWSNIQNRVEFLKGKLDVNSAPGKGTSVLIEVGV